MNSNQPWLKSKPADLFFILLPPILPVAVVTLFQDYFTRQTEVTVVWWVVLVLCIDVAHVYSTLFRLYWDPSTLKKHKLSLILIPVLAFLVGMVLYFAGEMIFWRSLAYLAVFHFVRQQYGFMRLYSRKENSSRTEQLIDNLTIYSATLYPLVYWHIFKSGTLSWFVEGDFFVLPTWIAPISKAIYFIILTTYLVKEVHRYSRLGRMNLPKNLLVFGTCLSWYVGIIAFDGDLAFTLLNVVAHGIPYMALVYFYGEKRSPVRFSFPTKSLLLFVGTILAFAYFEEGLWDRLVWNEHAGLFPNFHLLPTLTESTLLIVVVPLLTLPQVTHYVLDGFLWRMSKDSHLTAI